ncbi:T9SS type A sorting domain-containing protein [Ulvibacter antarcticus]|uniref:Putative secreted protein (Por secretion system target) n=1 Tax=Ulvibacter antarcticus TaxID=442714 RepID=A0A3L9YFE4_9FLAO|nr:T9SS type A sorting domain-containing protein [Ulvibacter antarcticus]RMA58080.1 putative secreted protein (Por secretion system target) [Ulvibacter antarcticus]
MKLKITILLLFITFSFYSQTVTTIYNESFNSTGLALNDDKLFVANPFDGRIQVLDWTENNPIATTFIDDIDIVQGIAINGEYLYAAINSNNPANDKIIRLNINDPNPTVDNYIVVENPDGIVFNGSDMYVNSQEKIFHIDTNNSNPIPIEIINDLDTFGTIGLAIAQNHLYITENSQIVKYELSNPIREIVISDLDGLTGIVKFTDDKMLFTSYSPNSIYELDLNSESYTSLFPTNLVSSWDIVYVDDYIFVSDFEGGQVNKIDVSALFVESFQNENISLYPNPTNNFLKIQNFKDVKNAIIYTVLGQRVAELEINENSIIDVQNLEHGIYLLKIDELEAVKFVKE